MSQPEFRYFAIFGAMRSGSNLLEQSLNQFEKIRCHGELFNPAFISGPKRKDYLGFDLKKREEKPFDLVERMISESAVGISGFRIFDGHDSRVVDHCLLDPTCAKIILQRDVLDSYISLKIARKTDQWLLRDSPHKKDAKVRFDAKEFKTYQSKSQDYYDKIKTALQESGQTAFWLRYPEQKNSDILNGVAKYLGIDEQIKRVKEGIRRQNPGPLSEKVENFDELQAFLGASGQIEEQSHHESTKQYRANIPRMVTCISQPILFVPTPGGPNEEVLRWMNAIDCGNQTTGDFAQQVEDGQILHIGHSQRTLFEWMQSNPGVIPFTAVKHPLPRVYDAFMQKIFKAGPNTYDVIRKQLIDSFEVELPNTGLCELPDRQKLEDAGYGVREHRNSFHSFLRFLKGNLLGQTSIRTDGLWASQMSFLAGFNSAVPISILAKEGQLDNAFRYMENALDLPPPKLGPPIKPQHVFELDEIYTRQTENLARKVYSQDYTRFGFDDYQAALEA